MSTLLARTPKTRTPRVIIYARVSRDQHGGRSVDQQLKIGRRIADDNGWTIVGEYADNDKSASRYASSTREDWPKVESSIAAGDADVLWVWEISRGTRDLVVWAQLAAVCREHRMYIALDDDVWDTTKPSHMKHLNTLMVDAVYESEKTASRINRDAADLAEAGHPWGYAGFGFRREYDPNTGDLIRQVPDPEQAKLVEEIVERLEAGERPYTIAKDLNGRGIPSPGGTVAGEERTRPDGTTYIAKGWTHQVITRLVSRPAMIGKRVHHGDIKTAGGWAPVIKDETRWQLVRDKVTARRRGRGGAIRHLLSGIAICDVCEGAIRVVHRPNERNLSYRCNGLYDGAPTGRGHVQRVQHLLEAHVVGMLFDRFSDPDVIEAFRAAPDYAEGVAQAREDLDRLSREMEELYADVEAGRVSRRMASADESRISREMSALQEKLRPRAADPLLEALVEEDPARVWEEWDLGQRREALRLVTEEIRVLKVWRRGRREAPAEESVRVVWREVDGF